MREKHDVHPGIGVELEDHPDVRPELEALGVPPPWIFGQRRVARSCTWYLKTHSRYSAAGCPARLRIPRAMSGFSQGLKCV